MLSWTCKELHVVARHEIYPPCLCFAVQHWKILQEDKLHRPQKVIVKFGWCPEMHAFQKDFLPLRMDVLVPETCLLDRHTSPFWNNGVKAQSEANYRCTAFSLQYSESISHPSVCFYSGNNKTKQAFCANVFPLRFNCLQMYSTTVWAGKEKMLCERTALMGVLVQPDRAHNRLLTV